MKQLTKKQREYLESQPLGRLATVGNDGRPHVVPNSFSVEDSGTVALGGFNMGATKKFADAHANPEVAFVVDDIVSTDPWVARGLEIRGDAEAVAEGGEKLGPGFGPAFIRIKPTHIVAWGLD